MGGDVSDETNRIRGWKSIADALGVSDDTARKYARDGAFKAHKDLLPVFRDYLGPYIDIGALEQWKARTTMAWSAWESVQRASAA
jgi:hypothetical protein